MTPAERSALSSLASVLDATMLIAELPSTTGRRRAKMRAIHAEACAAVRSLGDTIEASDGLAIATALSVDVAALIDGDA